MRRPAEEDLLGRSRIVRPIRVEAQTSAASYGQLSFEKEASCNNLRDADEILVRLQTSSFGARRKEDDKCAQGKHHRKRGSNRRVTIVEPGK